MTYSHASRDLFRLGGSVVSGGLVVAAVAGAGWFAGHAAKAQADSQSQKKQAGQQTAGAQQPGVVRVKWRHLPTVTRQVVRHTYSTVTVPVYVGGGASTSSSSSSYSAPSSSGGSSGGSSYHAPAPHHAPAPPKPAPAPSSGS